MGFDMGFPTRLNDFVTKARWYREDSKLSLCIEFKKDKNTKQTIELFAGTDVCLPAAAGIDSLTREALVAHLRMATLIDRHLPLSSEWDSNILAGATVFETAVGAVKVNTAAICESACIDVEFEENPSGTKRSVTFETKELREYFYQPHLQAHIIGAAIRKEFGSSTHVHDYPGDVLSETERSDIISYLTGGTFEIWV